MKNLISMTDFILEDKYVGSPINMNKQYAKFLKQPLELWMFVPCDENGNVLEEPKDYKTYMIMYSGVRQTHSEILKCQKYKQAKERCLFEGFEMYKGNPYNYNKARAFTKDYIDEKWNIEKIIHWELELTETAIKQLGL